MDEKQLRPPDMMADKRACLEADQRFLMDRKVQWEHVPCPACDADAPEPFGDKDGFAFTACGDCGTVYTNPRPSQDLLHAFYAGSQNYSYWSKHIFPATAEVRRERIFRPRAEMVADICRGTGAHGGTLIEVGAAYGLFLEEAARTGAFSRVVGVEPTPELARGCRDKGLEIIELPVEQVDRPGSADVVAAFEVIEHLHSPRGFVAGCVRMLRPGGTVILSCPNVRGFDMALLGTASDSFNHEHLNYFHPDSLSRLLTDCGLTVAEVRTPGALDAGIVRDRALAGSLSLDGQPFLEEVLLRRWDEVGAAFQRFLADNGLSSHMLVVARLND